MDQERVKEQASLAEKLQDLLLKDYLRLAEDNKLTATDRKNLQDLLRANGWSFDANELPQDLKKKLTREVEFNDELDGGMRVVR